MELLKTCLTPIELAACLGGITVQGVYKILKALDIETKSISSRRILVPAKGVRKIFEDRGFQYPTVNISYQLVKGGVGKTSFTFSSSIRSSSYGARVLVIDLDQQGNTTRSFNVESRNKPVWLNIFRDKVPVSESIIEISDNLCIIPSNLNNSRLDVELTQSNANLRDTINDLLSPVRDRFDVVFFDCPPALNKINTAVTCASDIVILPVNPDSYAMDGLDFTIAELGRIKKDFKLKNDYRVVWNKFDARERLAPVYMHELAKKEDLIGKILPVVCRVDASLKNAVHFSQSVFESNRKTPIREDFDQFTKEILGINQWNESKNLSANA